jgi:hypothetical protein
VGEAVKVYITKRDIELGEPSNPHSCPIACAVRRKTEQAWMIGNGVAKRWDSGVLEAFSLTPAARRFAANFDEGKPVKPGWLEVWE